MHLEAIVIAPLEVGHQIGLAAKGHCFVNQSWPLCTNLSQLSPLTPLSGLSWLTFIYNSQLYIVCSM
jgi:hypothetical protein